MKTALIAGATGATGRDLVNRLAEDPDWQVYALARNPVELPGACFISVDLTDEQDSRQKLGSLSDVTHIFYTARFDHKPSQPEPVDRNLMMLRNTVEAVEHSASGLKHVHLVHGTKYYGSHIGPFKTPADEADPRCIQDVFYYAQEDYIIDRQRDKDWTWSTSRPHGICHDVPSEPRNLVLLTAVYALICKELGLPLTFPGTPESYDALFQCSSTGLLVSGMLWASTTPECGNQSFNMTNGDFIRWRNLWPKLADHFGLELGPVKTVRLAEAMANKGPVWDEIVRKNGLPATPFDDLIVWSYGDYVFRCGWDIMSSMNKARAFGFTETLDTEAEFFRLFNVFRERGVLPR
jgi:nucleoside-diphosphate-sugar epimerase